MRKGGLFLALALLPCVLTGCGSSKDEDNLPPPNAPINNKAPEAQSAPAAPGPGADVPRPGGGMKKGG
jgi:hypothetical protein